MKSYFTNTVKAEWLADGREMIILEGLAFSDAAGKPWIAPAGSIVDGASVPRFFWRLIGSPFVGKYRRASVIHDVYCKTKSESYQDTALMFKEAMLVDGVAEHKAETMYNAVITFGPKW